MKIKHGILTIILLCISISQLMSQNNIDSVLLEKFPVIIGNIGFSTDSVEIVVGKVPRGEITQFDFQVYNYGKEPVAFTNGKSNKFISVEFDPIVLAPSMTGNLAVSFDADIELDLGDFNVEIAVTSDDKKNPYKFLTVLMEIIEGDGGGNNGKFDSVPHIVFDHYNHDYGHLKRGKILYHTFIITNEGGVPLQLTEVQTPKEIEIIDVPTYAIMPGENSILRLKINTRGKVGVQHQTILVNSNDPENPLVILGLHGSVRVYPTHKKSSNQCGEVGQRY